MNSLYAKQKADEFEALANDTEKAKIKLHWLVAENREDAAYWRGVQYVFQELEAGRIKQEVK